MRKLLISLLMVSAINAVNSDILSRDPLVEDLRQNSESVCLFDTDSHEAVQLTHDIEASIDELTRCGDMDLNLEELMSLDLPKPELENPSRVKVAVREWGIAMVIAYFDFKEWCVKKYHDNLYSFKILEARS